MADALSLAKAPCTATRRARPRCSPRRCGTPTVTSRCPLPSTYRAGPGRRSGRRPRRAATGCRGRRHAVDAGLTDPLPADAAPADRRAELTDIVTDLYARLARHRIAIKLVDRCAPELPDLAAVWFGSGRHALVDAAAEYLPRRRRAGTASLPGPVPLVARTVVELCALWAVHSHFDPAPDPRTTARPDPIDDAAAATTSPNWSCGPPGLLVAAGAEVVGVKVSSTMLATATCRNACRCPTTASMRS